jgi:two-component system response regulator HydG
MSSQRTVLFVEDDATFRRVLARELRDLGFVVHDFADGDAALAALRGALSGSAPPAALVDLRLPGRSGQDVLRELVALDPDLQVVMLTGHGGVSDAVAAMRAGAFEFLLKPTPLPVVEQALRRAIERRRLLLENRELRRAATAASVGILGDSPPVRELVAMIERLAPAAGHVLVCGESGTGKELVARALHERSARRDGAFVVVNCASVAANLVESELFGHARGAFTGADRNRSGVFDAADGGTLFLDEVGELATAVQAALLRALQFGEVRPVGASATHAVDVRVIAATNRDLRTRVADGAFREDLYYRLAALQITVPPLRERRADVLILAQAFLAREAARAGAPLRVAPAAAERLLAHDWPGNVRELQNAMQRLAVLCAGPTIELADVERYVIAAGRPAAPAAGPGTLPTLDLEQLERLAIVAALERFGGDKPAAARELGIALKTLYNKIERYGLK